MPAGQWHIAQGAEATQKCRRDAAAHFNGAGAGKFGQPVGQRRNVAGAGLLDKPFVHRLAVVSGPTGGAANQLVRQRGRGNMDHPFAGALGGGVHQAADFERLVEIGHHDGGDLHHRHRAPRIDIEQGYQAAIVPMVMLCGVGEARHALLGHGVDKGLGEIGVAGAAVGDAGDHIRRLVGDAGTFVPALAGGVPVECGDPVGGIDDEQIGLQGAQGFAHLARPGD